MKKNTFKHIALLAAAALAFAGCRIVTEQEQSPRQPSDYRTILFHACEISTKTAFGQGQDGVYPTLWTSNDQAVKLALNFTEAAEVTVTPDESFRTASFSADIDGTITEAPYTFYAVSPASAARALSPSREAWSISIPAVQTPLEGSVDESAQILAAASIASSELPASVDLHFNHLTAYGRMTLKNLELGDATIERIDITATTPFVGDWYWECADGHTITDNGASSTLTLITSATEDIWFACAPVDMSGQIAVFTIYTNKGALVKEVEFPQGRKFTSGRIAVFGVDMSGVVLEENDDFQLVTDASSLHVGDQVIIANQEGTYALGGQSDGSKQYRIPEAVTIANGVVTNPGNAEILTLAYGTEEGTWALVASDGCLCTLALGNYLSVESSVTGNSSWTISLASGGAATITALSGSSNIMRYNSQNPRFSAYGSNSNLKDPLAIYRKGGSGSSSVVTDDPITDNYDYGCYLGTDTRTYTAGTDQISRQYSADGVQTFTLINPDAKEQMEITGYRRSLVKGDEVTITVNWREGRNTIVSDYTARVRVVKEDGPRVWLGNGSGNGFIIKK